MKKVKNVFLPILVLLLLVGSCKKDDVPLNAIRDDYLGSWQCDEYDINQLLIGSFLIEIVENPNVPDKIFIDNFAQFGPGIQAEAIVENTSIRIPQQLVYSTAVSGSGFIANKLTILELQYIIDDGSGQPENITATCTKL